MSTKTESRIALENRIRLDSGGTLCVETSSGLVGFETTPTTEFILRYKIDPRTGYVADPPECIPFVNVVHGTELVVLTADLVRMAEAFAARGDVADNRGLAMRRQAALTLCPAHPCGCVKLGEFLPSRNV